MEERTLNKDWLITIVLWFFLWVFWAHRFYNWKIGTGFLMLFTLGWLWIWALIDWIIIIFWGFKNADGTAISIKTLANSETTNNSSNTPIKQGSVDEL